MIVNDFESPPVFYQDQFLAAPDINVLERNCAYLDQMAYRREPVFDSMPRKGDPSSAWHTISGYLLWRGGLLFRSFYTVLTVRGRRVGTLPDTARVRIFINGVLRAEFVPASGDWTQAVTLQGQSYTPEFPLLIEVRTCGLSATDRTSEWWITSVSAAPSSAAPTSSAFPPLITIAAPTVPGAWKPMPSFHGAYSPLLLNKLSSNQLYLYDRMNAVPLASNRAYVNAVMSHRAEDFEIWTGTASRYTSVEVYRLTGSITLLAAGSDTIKVYMDDVLATTLGPWTTVGTHAFSLPQPFPAVAIPARVRIRLVYNSTTHRDPSLSSRLSILAHRTDPYNPGWPVLTPPAVTVPAANYSSSGVDATLNRIIFMLNAIKTRIDHSGSFTSVRAYRDNFGYDEHGRRSVDRFHPATFQRRGSRLVVYGKNAFLGFGGQVFELDDDNHATYKYKFANEQNIIPGDKYDLKTIYLDSIKGLYPGDLYYLIGDISFIAEYIK